MSEGPPPPVPPQPPRPPRPSRRRGTRRRGGPPRRGPPPGGRPPARRPARRPTRRPRGGDRDGIELAHYRVTQSEGQARTLPPGQDPFLGGALGPCRVLEFLGEGGAGRVYRARHERLDFEVALKVISSEFQGRAKALERFQREARVAARLSHNNIARVYDVDQEGTTHYIIQELVRGESLEARVKRKGPLKQATVVGIGASLASGLASIHQAGVVHRDLKPGNVILTRQGVPKLIDFGIAKDVGVDSGTHQDVVLGTPRFMAPEQATARDLVGPPSDLYGLGGTLYFALTGRAPLEPETGEPLLVFLNRRLQQPTPPVANLRQDVFPELDQLVQRLLATDPEQRPQAQEVSDLLNRMLPLVEQLSEPGSDRSSSWRLAPVQGDAGTQGLLSDMPLIEILQGIEFNEKSGELELHGEREGEPFTGRVTFKDGQPHEASTSDGALGSEAVRRMLDLSSGSFVLRKEVQLRGPPQVEVSFTRLVLDHTRQSDESERLSVPPLDSHELLLESDDEVPDAQPAGKAELGRSATLRLHKDGKPRRTTGDVSRALLQLEQRVCAPPPGEPFLGCDLGVFHVDALVGVERGERHYLATVRESGERALLRVFPLTSGPYQQEFRRLAERAAGPLTLKGTRLEACLGGGSSRDAFYAGYLPTSGQPLLEAIALRGVEEPFPPAEVVRVLGQVGLALQALHSRSMVHGNVSPATIRLERGDTVTLTGAGMGRLHPAHRFLGNDGSVPGEVGFVGPEVLDSGKLTPAADMYALGCVAWTMLVGHHPFSGGTDLELVTRSCTEELPTPRREGGQAIPPGLATIVGKLAGRSSKQRYTDANDFLTDLTAFERGKEVAAFRKESTKAAPTPERKAPRDASGQLKLLLALTTVISAGAVALALWSRGKAQAIELESPLEGYSFRLVIDDHPDEAPAAPPD